MFESIKTIRNPAIRLYALIGYCVSAAADIEHELFECFRLAERSSPAAAAATFFKAPSHEHRLKVANEALRRFLTDERMVVEWSQLHGHLGEQLGPKAPRNLIAHNPASGGVYVSYPRTPQDQIDAGETTLHVMMEVSQHYGLVALGRKKERAETIESLSHYADALTHLHIQLLEFRKELIEVG